MTKKIEDKYKVLDQISHVLHRPQTYVGSNKFNKALKRIIEDGKIVEQEINHIPSFLKIVDEVVTNSVDEHKRNDKLNTLKVDVDIETGRIEVEDNGGIPVVIHKEHNQYVPEVIFGNLMSGSNYDDSDERTVAGLNGLGAKLTNIFSSEFTVSTGDGSNEFIQTFTENMRSRSEPKVKKSRKKYTKISFVPDFSQFKMDGIDNDHFKMIEKRVIDIAACNPTLTVFFNGTKLNFNDFSDYIKLYNEDFFYEVSKDKNWEVGVSVSENGFQQVSFANGTETYDGGTHVDYVLNQIITELRSFFNKKHKYDVKPSEIKNHLFIFLNSTVINPSFSSQTKEKLITEVKDFGTSYEVSKKMIQSILKSEIVNSILDWIQQKKNAEESKLQRELNKKVSKIKVDKLIDSKGKDRWKHSLGIFEGDSASAAYRKYRDPQTMGAFALRGKFINVNDLNNAKLLKNKEVVNLMAAIGLKLGQEINLKDLRYGRIYLYVDADVDGNSIAASLLNFFHTYWPDMYERKMIYKVETPIVVAISKKDPKNKVLLYSQTEYNEWSTGVNLKQYDLKYKKGLAALVDDEYDAIINNPKLTLITKDDISTESLEIWFGKDSSPRKDKLLEK